MAIESNKGNTDSPVQVNPSKIMQIGMGFWASKVMLSAVKFGLFTVLSAGPLTAKQIKEKLKFNCTDRHVFDWLDALFSLGFVERKGLMEEAFYSNAADTGFFLDRNKPSYMGGMLEMANNRLYKFWGDLDEALLSGLPQNEIKDNPQHNMEFFNELYKNPERLQEFMNAMSGIQTGNFIALANRFDFNRYKTLLDIGGADGWLSIHVCLHHPEIKCTTFDLPPVRPLAEKKIASFNLSDRINVVDGDFTTDDFPQADIIVMGNILHGMNEERKQATIKKIYETLPAGGVFIVIENIIDNERRQNTFGMLMSLNMLIENGDAFDYTFSDFERWGKQAGFSRTELIALSGPTSAALAYK